MDWQSSAVGNLRISLPHFTDFPPKADGSGLNIAGFLVGCWHLTRTLVLAPVINSTIEQ